MTPANHDDNGASEARWLHPDEPERERFIKRGCVVLSCFLACIVLVAVGTAWEWF